jgi:hypothetical protein
MGPAVAQIVRAKGVWNTGFDDIDFKKGLGVVGVGHFDVINLRDAFIGESVGVASKPFVTDTLFPLQILKDGTFRWQEAGMSQVGRDVGI